MDNKGLRPVNQLTPSPAIGSIPINQYQRQSTTAPPPQKGLPTVVLPKNSSNVNTALNMQDVTKKLQVDNMLTLEQKVKSLTDTSISREEYKLSNESLTALLTAVQSENTELKRQLGELTTSFTIKVNEAVKKYFEEVLNEAINKQVKDAIAEQLDEFETNISSANNLATEVKTQLDTGYQELNNSISKIRGRQYNTKPPEHQTTLYIESDLINLSKTNYKEFDKLLRRVRSFNTQHKVDEDKTSIGYQNKVLLTKVNALL
jgi:hypothetical protein